MTVALDRDAFASLVAQARLAPSVHNIQPTRWRLRDGAIELLGDRRRRLPAADPSGHDVRLSHGAALEGLAIALDAIGLAIARVDVHRDCGEELEPIAGLTIAPRDAPPRRDAEVASRATWRGAFAVEAEAVAPKLDRLAACGDLVLVRERAAVRDIATLADAAGLHFLRDTHHRAELVHWMRLSRRHPDYARDGLSREAMQLSAIEALGAGLVLGRLFAPLDRFGLAAPLVAEHGKTASAAAIALFHRLQGEDPLETGRHFYRAWLAIERAGLCACPISVLADWPESNRTLAARHAVAPGRRLVNIFRIGEPRGARVGVRARLEVNELILP